MELDPEIVAYYERGEERDRVAGPSVERVRTLELLERLLPAPPAVVLRLRLGRVEAEPSLLGASAHLLAVGRR